jgi:WD40 repeat protein/acylphosphatase
MATLPFKRFGVSEDAVWHCAVSPDGGRVLAISKDVKRYDPRSGDATITRENVGIIGVAATDHHGVLAWNQQRVFVWEWDTSNPSPDFSSRDATIQAATLLPRNNRHMAIVARYRSEETVHLSVDGLASFSSVPEEPQTLWMCGVRPSSAACGRKDATVHIWHFPESGEPERLVLNGHTAAVLRGVAARDTGYLATASKDLSIRTWSIQEEPRVHAEPVATLTGHTDEITGLAFTSDSRKLISCSRDRTIRIWSIRDGRLLTVLADHRDWVTHVAVNPAGTRLASCSDDGTIRLWDLENFALIGTAYASSRFLSLAMSDDTICAGDAAGAFWILEYGETPTVPAELARRYLVSGRVAGVGFRQFVQQFATTLGVRGSVRNLPDGRIEVHVIGSEQQHAAMKDALTKGPGGALVTSVEEEIVPLTAVEGFSVVR